MRNIGRPVVLAMCLALAACSPPKLFPSEVMEGVDPDFDFSRWRMLPNQAIEKKIQLGGRIIEAERRDQAVTIAIAQLPIVQHPAYGPKDKGKRGGDFAATFDGPIDPLFLQKGNRLIVVGTTKPAKIVRVDDLPRSLPNIEVRCVHIWNTGDNEISDFPSFGAGYETLENRTFCTGPR